MNITEYWRQANEELKALGEPEARYGELKAASFDYQMAVHDAVTELIDMRKLGMV